MRQLYTKVVQCSSALTVQNTLTLGNELQRKGFKAKTYILGAIEISVLDYFSSLLLTILSMVVNDSFSQLYCILRDGHHYIIEPSKSQYHEV